MSESTAAAAAAAAALHAQQQPPGQAEAAHLTDNLLPEWNAALTSSLPGAGLLPAQALPPGSASGDALLMLQPFLLGWDESLRHALDFPDWTGFCRLVFMLHQIVASALRSRLMSLLCLAA